MSETIEPRRGLRQGTDRHALAERGHDLYETPAEATRALLRNYPLPRRVWEPAAGRGAIVRELVAVGIDVVATDIAAHAGADPGIMAGRDFLLEQRAPEAVKAIITTPPFKCADAFVRHGLALGLPVIALLRLAALEGSKRADIVDAHLHEVLPGIERLPMMHRDGWTGSKTSSTTPYAWYVFRPEPRTGPIALRRISWREPAASQVRWAQP